MSGIRIAGLTKRYGRTPAVEEVSLDVASGELFFLLGPSGCGKTTLLRIVAGLLEPDAGEVCFGEEEVTGWPAHRRNAAMVFQSYALWPHMTVAQNVEFGLRMRKVGRRERRRRTAEAVELVCLEGLERRKPAQLSGGQQQRVALARAIVVKPRILLLDEPLSNLDAKLRVQMREEIRRICKAAGPTTLYVTHDQKEAIAVADRIALFQAGRLVQTGTPAELHRRPANRFAAEFLGHSNILPVRLEKRDAEGVTVGAPFGWLRAEGPQGEAVPLGHRTTCTLRPEALALRPAERGEEKPSEPNSFFATIRAQQYLGESALLTVEASGVELHVLQLNPSGRLGEGARVELHVDPADVVLLPD